MARKTISVEDVRGWVNTRLAIKDSTMNIDGLTPEQAFRLGVASLLEQILHATDNYHGYNFQASEILPEDEIPAALAANRSLLRDGYDDTRRRYS